MFGGPFSGVILFPEDEDRSYVKAVQQMWANLIRDIQLREERLLMLDGKTNRTLDEQAELDAATLLAGDMWEDY